MPMHSRRLEARDTASRYRARMREQGLRPIQVWVPGTRSPKFAAECRRQSMAVARGPEDDVESFLEAAAQELDGWK